LVTKAKLQKIKKSTLLTTSLAKAILSVTELRPKAATLILATYRPARALKGFIALVAHYESWNR
jgi:hypothetical protein